MKTFILTDYLVIRSFTDPLVKGNEDSGNEIEIGQICNIENMVQVDHTR